jgi:hypothetical protein
MRLENISASERTMAEPPEIPGADQVVQWFGYWPSFHDAEVLSITLNRSGASYVQIHTWEKTSEVDANGYYVRTKHAVVTFLFEGFLMDREEISRMRIEWFNHQNVLTSLRVVRIPDGHSLFLDGIFGVDACIDCERISVTLEPGMP